MDKDLQTCRVLVTATSFGKQDPTLKTTLEEAVGEVRFNPENRPLTAPELTPLVRGMDGLIAGLDEINAAVIDASTGLKVIARYGVGVDRVDVAAATKRGIVVTNTPGANSAAVAELAIGLMLALGRHLCRAAQATRRGEWPRYSGVGLRGKTVGLVGFGSIGQEVAARLQSFGCRLLASDPYLKPETLARSGVSLVTLDALLASADIVSLHTALTPATAGMIDAHFLRQMKPGAFLVNTARGELIDEAALQRALESGHLRGAALDCFHQEPPGPNHPLLQLSQVIATPHTGSHTDEAMNTMGRMSLEACLAALRGERPPHVINPQVYSAPTV